MLGAGEKAQQLECVLSLKRLASALQIGQPAATPAPGHPRPSPGLRGYQARMRMRCAQLHKLGVEAHVYNPSAGGSRGRGIRGSGLLSAPGSQVPRG